MLNVYVDESGNLGTKDRYFVLAILVPQRPKRIVNALKKFCAHFGITEIKASKLSFSQKQSIFQKITAINDYTISYVVADKTKITTEKFFEDKNIFYNYLFSHLIKKTLKNSSEDVCILLDNHSIKHKSINSLSDYIKIKAYTQWNFKGNLTITYTDSVHSKSVQAADIVANAIFAKYMYGKDHFYKKLIISESIKFPYTDFGK